MAKVNINFNLPILILKEGKSFVAYTPALDISTSGKTYDEAKSRFNDLVKLFIEELIEAGTLEQVLNELGWKKRKQEWWPPRIIAQETERMTIPALA